MAQVDRKLTASAGEHFVCSTLAQLGSRLLTNLPAEPGPPAAPERHAAY
jgi:hypothetical protein